MWFRVTYSTIELLACKSVVAVEVKQRKKKKKVLIFLKSASSLLKCKPLFANVIKGGV